MVKGFCISVILIVVMGLAIVFIHSEPAPSAKQAQYLPTPEDSFSSSKVMPHNENLNSDNKDVSFEALSEIDQESTGADSQMELADQALNIWELSTDPIGDQFQLHNAVTEKVAIDIQAEHLDNLKPGMELELVLPDAPPLNVTITQRRPAKDSITLMGSSIEPNQMSEVILTSGNGSVHGWIYSNGHYAIMSQQDDGVLYKVPPRSDIETIASDVLIPKINGAQSDEE